MLKIETKDKKILEVSQEIRGMSLLIESALMDSADVVEISATQHDSKEVSLVIQYCEHYKWSKTETTLELPLTSRDPKVYIEDKWERDFITALNLEE